jgi:hypothetical protein
MLIYNTDEKVKERNQFFDDLAAMLRRERREDEAKTTGDSTPECGKLEERKDDDAATV